MKILLFTTFVLFYALCVSSLGIRVKRGLSSDEQKKLVDTLNADRQELGEKMHWTFENLTYDIALEKRAEAKTCKEITASTQAAALKLNNVAREANEKVKKMMGFDAVGRVFYHPEQTKIGCSKEFTCSHTFTEADDVHKEALGKTVALYGICFLGPKAEGFSYHSMKSPEEVGMPDWTKYGDLLGVVGSSGRIFSITVFLAILVFYF